MKIVILLLGVLSAGSLYATPGAQNKNVKTLVLGGGCFWCLEALFEELQGVISVENGYAGGNKPNVTYSEVCSGTTGHAEVGKITYDSSVISGEDLLRLFFTAHDPTTLNRQGPDVGTQYRSVIFYSNSEEKAMAEKIRKEVAKKKIWPNPIVTTIEPLKNYTRAEAYHQNYYSRFEQGDAKTKAGMNAAYCRAIIEPKVREFRKKYASKLKKKP